MFAQYDFTDGGFWMAVLILWALALYGGVVAQFWFRRRVDFSRALWGGLAGLFALGVLATSLGVIHGMSALAGAPGEALYLSQVLGIASIPTAFAAMLAIPAAVLIGCLSVSCGRAMGRAS